MAKTVYLYGDSKTVYERSVKRDHGGKRHPGHLTDCYHKEEYSEEEPAAVDAVPDYEGFCRWMRERNYNIGLGHTIAVDVTDFTRIDYEELIKEIRLRSE